MKFRKNDRVTCPGRTALGSDISFFAEETARGTIIGIDPSDDTVLVVWDNQKGDMGVRLEQFHFSSELEPAPKED